MPVAGLGNPLFSGTLTVQFDGLEAEPGLPLTAGRLQLEPSMASGEEGITSLSVDFASLSVDLAASRIVRLAPVATGLKRFLKLQPVQFTSGGLGKTGSRWGMQLAAARAVWGQCCIDFIDLGMITVESPLAKSSTHRCTLIKALAAPVAPDEIVVF
jgi:hypothetical protein